MTPQPEGPSPVMLDGVPIDRMTQDDVIDHVIRRLASRSGGTIITANADQMRRLSTPAFASLVRRAALIVPDGMPLVWASRLKRDPLPERVNGTNLLVALCSAARDASKRVFLLGGAPGVADEAASVLQRRAEGLQVCGTSSPPIGFTTDPAKWREVVDDVVAAQPDLVFVALGFPMQEEVGLELSEHLPNTWFMGCGGALDLLSGRVDRAPVLMQRIGAEWLHRLSQEPRRLARRYLIDDAPYVLGMLLRARRERT